MNMDRREFAKALAVGVTATGCGSALAAVAHEPEFVGFMACGDSEEKTYSVHSMIGSHRFRGIAELAIDMRCQEIGIYKHEATKPRQDRCVVDVGLMLPYPGRKRREITSAKRDEFVTVVTKKLVEAPIKVGDRLALERTYYEYIGVRSENGQCKMIPYEDKLVGPTWNEVGHDVPFMFVRVK